MVHQVDEGEDAQGTAPAVQRVHDELLPLGIALHSTHSPECPPDVEAHDVEPEETADESNVGYVAQPLAEQGVRYGVGFQVDNGHRGVGHGETHDVAH